MLTQKGLNPLNHCYESGQDSKMARQKNVAQIRKKLEVVEGTPIIPFSAQTKEGKEEIWEYIDYFVKEIDIHE